MQYLQLQGKFVDSVCSIYSCKEVLLSVCAVTTVARKFVDSVCSIYSCKEVLLSVCAVTIVARKFVDSVNRAVYGREHDFPSF